MRFFQALGFTPSVPVLPSVLGGQPVPRRFTPTIMRVVNSFQYSPGQCHIVSYFRLPCESLVRCLQGHLQRLACFSLFGVSQSYALSPVTGHGMFYASHGYPCVTASFFAKSPVHAATPSGSLHFRVADSKLLPPRVLSSPPDGTQQFGWTRTNTERPESCTNKPTYISNLLLLYFTRNSFIFIIILRIE